MDSRFLLRNAVAVLATGAIVTLTTVSSASALAGVSGTITLWKDDNYSGVSQSRVSYDTNFFNDSFGNVTSSFVNKTSDWWILYDETSYGGNRLCIRPNSHDANIGNDTDFEDDIQSAKKFSTSQPSGCDDITGTAN